MQNLADSLRSAASAVADLGTVAHAISELDDAGLVAAQAHFGELMRAAQPYGAWIAGEISARSRHELGFSGLAKREGFVDATALIQSVSGSSRAEAAKLVNVGTMFVEVVNAAAAENARAASGGAAVETPWHDKIVAAVADGALSVDAAEAIRKGLGAIDGAVSTDDLSAAAAALMPQARTMSAEQLFRRARERRDELDAAGVARRQKARRDLQYFSARRRPDGMVVGSYAFADEDGQLLLAAYDSATSPKRGGPRFVEGRDERRAQQIESDPRTPAQIAADAIIALLRIGIDADPNAILGRRRPSVRVIVADTSLWERTGSGWIEGSSDAVSFETVERQLCSTGTVGIRFDDDGQCVNVGRDQRLFTERQRVGLAVRDGGCRVGSCDRPPSWCEAHHIDYWGRDHGKTDIADGVLLCRFHHMLIHNNHWQIVRESGEYWLVPPAAIDAEQKRQPMPSKSAAMRDLAHRRQRLQQPQPQPQPQPQHQHRSQEAISLRRNAERGTLAP